MPFEGKVEGAQGAWAVVKAIQGGRIVGQCELESDGGWELDLPVTPERIVVATRRGGIAAVSVPLDHARAVSLPARHPVVLTGKDPPLGAQLTLDPVSLRGFPQADLWVLRTDLGGIVELHVVEAQAADPVSLRLQEGRYRLGGGVIGLHPGQESWGVSEIVDETGGRTTAHNGSLELAVPAAKRYEVVFSRR